MKKRTRQTIILLILFSVSIFLIFYWFNWKLFIILLLWGWAVNLDNKIKGGDNDS